MGAGHSARRRQEDGQAKDRPRRFLSLQRKRRGRARQASEDLEEASAPPPVPRPGAVPPLAEEEEGVGRSLREGGMEPRSAYAEVDPSLPASTLALEWKSAARRVAEKNCNLLVAEQANLNIKSGREAEDMTAEFLQQIIRCFPFPAPKEGPSGGGLARRRSHGLLHGPDADSPDAPPARRVKSLKTPRHNNRARSPSPPRPKSALSSKSILKQMVLNSVDTMAVTALPLDCWLRERLKHWCQLSGHEGTIVPATDSTLWKKRSGTECNEATAYRALMDDVLCPFVPKFHKEVDYRGETFIEIDDLTAKFTDPAICDVKMGSRTFLESEVKNPVKRKDLYVKMTRIDPSEPTEEEHEEQALTKLRYMQFRERESSTAALGFRVEAIKHPGEELKKGFQKVRTREEVMAILIHFLRRRSAREPLLKRLRAIREKVPESAFFQSHEVIGSSLLLIYDRHKAGVWLIDFAKALPVDPAVRPLSHHSPWALGNHEDGWLRGLDNLIRLLEDSKHQDLASLSPSPT